MLLCAQRNCVRFERKLCSVDGVGAILARSSSSMFEFGRKEVVVNVCVEDANVALGARFHRLMSCHGSFPRLHLLRHWLPSLAVSPSSTATLARRLLARRRGLLPYVLYRHGPSVGRASFRCNTVRGDYTRICHTEPLLTPVIRISKATGRSWALGLLGMYTEVSSLP